MTLQDKNNTVRRSRGRPSCADLVGASGLLQKARGVFAKHGFEAATLRSIAQASGTDPALVAHHFGSKEALWMAVVNQIADEVSATLATLRELRSRLDLSPRARVEHALELVIGQNFKSPDIGMFFATAATEQGGRLTVLYERLSRPFHEAFIPLLQDAMEAGAITRQDPHVLQSMLASGIFHTISYSHVLRNFSALPDKPKQFQAAVLKAALIMLG